MVAGGHGEGNRIQNSSLSWAFITRLGLSSLHSKRNAASSPGGREYDLSLQATLRAFKPNLALLEGVLIPVLLLKGR